MNRDNYEDRLEQCHLCGCCDMSDMAMDTPSGCRPGPKLVRLNWDWDKPDCWPIFVAHTPGYNDAILCEDCIRQIKRLRFSDIAASPPFVSIDPELRPKPEPDPFAIGDMDDEDIPF